MIKSPRMEELDVLETVLTAKITTKEPNKVALSRVKFTHFLVEHYGIRYTNYVILYSNGV